MTDEKEKRRAPKSFRPTKGREDDFDALVAASGQSVNAFLNDLVFGKHRRSRAELKVLARMLAQDAAKTDALDKFDPLAAQDDEIKALLRDIRQHLIENRAALLLGMRRKP